ncbi:polyphosphate kinase 2 [Thioalkalivibrio sp. XN279]|uniref:polyphosphate kinase 2 n=1 Tax=Thioalkalivibrio sp. XN279 TaxID=2714953 RepID=UPI001407CB5D|nr:polyphosphate kinase 2 [Thioalkalivibrio sp. XN279]NHA13933.1 polyphosphate kinase 2 [Thioalkalivibrio sp. XN279]
MTSDLPFDGAVSRYLAAEAPEEVRLAVEEGKKRDILDDSYPYERWLKKPDYEDELDRLQIELAKCQRWVQDSGARLVVIFEGRDGAGKGGAIRRMTMNLNPRVARVVALSKPSERERSQWYFQRYVPHLPAAGEITLFDRSWYNRGVIEQVFGFCTPEERARFFAQLPGFESTLVSEGIVLVKLWLNVGRAEQLRRMLARESDPLKQWKLSAIDIQGLARWDDYSNAIEQTFRRSHTPVAPWTVIRADDKYRARLAVIRAVLGVLDYTGKDETLVDGNDPAICGGPELWRPA